jgi:cholesterol transport system auxiliary component
MKISHCAPLLFALSLSACSSLLNVQRQPFAIYSPQYTGVSATGARVDWQLIVETPLASATLQTPRMLVMPTPGVLEVFPGARWSDSTPALLRGLIVQGFQASQRIVGVGGAQSGMRADYALAIELRDFQIEYRDGKPEAAIRFQANLLDYSSNRVLATQSFNAVAPAAAADAANAFSAFQTAINTVVPQLVDWTLREGSAVHGKSASHE